MKKFRYTSNSIPEYEGGVLIVTEGIPHFLSPTKEFIAFYKEVVLNLVVDETTQCKSHTITRIE